MPDRSSSSSSAPPHTNRLAREKSPYLLQHQHNPVDWFPWGEEAFAKARQENKPIFLSIGYSTCHWCHVMERESFENPNIAAQLNAHFVSIKVDREERPDVDKIYMTFVQAMTGSGGWPLNVFLTPDLKPFYGGTYWPPEGRYGRPSFLQVLDNVQQAWQTRQDQILSSAEELSGRLQELMQRTADSAVPLALQDLQEAARQLKSGYDPVHGGFGSAPKFPTPSHPIFLLRYGLRYRDRQAVDMVLHTCQRMAAGGIHDQLGGGFARYSVDAQWLVPHFEKMLYDNAQLVDLYLDAYLASQQMAYAHIARDILDYVLRDMTHPHGGFYSAEDADSEGHEGKFYTWTRRELSQLLAPDEFQAAIRYFGVTEQGNFQDHSHPQPLTQQNVLQVAATNLSEAEMASVESAKAKLLQARGRRVRPHLDDKILASWNGLMLGAMARAGAVLQEPRYQEAARRNLAFLQQNLWDPATQTLAHRWRDGQCDTVQLLEAYACVLDGVLDSYEASLNPADLEFALALANAMLDRFYDPQQGGFWQTPATTPHLITRVKEDYDGAQPSGNSVAILALSRLGIMTGHDPFREAARRSLRLFSRRLQQMPQAFTHMLLAVDFSLDEPQRLVLVGDPASPQTHSLLTAAHQVPPRPLVLLGHQGPVEPFARSLPAKDNQPTAYLCLGTSCQPPIHDPLQLKTVLQNQTGQPTPPKE